MALSLQDLDALIADPRVPALHAAAQPGAIPALPASMQPTAANTARSDFAARQAQTGIPSMGANAAPPIARTASIPSLGAAPEMAPGAQAIPSLVTGPESITSGTTPQDINLAKPKESAWKKIEHGLATAGNVAGDIVAPGPMTLIPGTQLHKEFEQKREAQLEAEKARTGLEGAQTGEAQAETWKALHPEAASESEMAFRAQAAEGLGLTPGTPEYQQYVGTGTFQRFAPQKPVNETPQEQTYNAYMRGGPNGTPQINPATNKPWTEQEALAAVNKAPATNETQEDARFEQIASDQQLGKPVSKEDKAWADAYKERKQLTTQPALIYDTGGQLTGSINPRTMNVTPVKPGTVPGTTSQGQGMNEKQTEAFNKDYINPANAIERSYDMFQDAYDAIKAGDAKTGAEDMLLLSQHLATTFGQVKGSRMNRDLIQEHKDAIGLQDKLERFANNLASGQQLSPDQREEFNGLISNMRNLTWQIATKEAVRRNQPIDFLPANVQIKMQDSKGKVREIPGNQVQGYLDKGIKLAE